MSQADPPDRYHDGVEFFGSRVKCKQNHPLTERTFPNPDPRHPHRQCDGPLLYDNRRGCYFFARTCGAVYPEGRGFCCGVSGCKRSEDARCDTDLCYACAHGKVVLQVAKNQTQPLGERVVITVDVGASYAQMYGELLQKAGNNPLMRWVKDSNLLHRGMLLSKKAQGKYRRNDGNRKNFEEFHSRRLDMNPDTTPFDSWEWRNDLVREVYAGARKVSFIIKEVYLVADTTVRASTSSILASSQQHPNAQQHHSLENEFIAAARLTTNQRFCELPDFQDFLRSEPGVAAAASSSAAAPSAPADAASSSAPGPSAPRGNRKRPMAAIDEVDALPNAVSEDVANGAEQVVTFQAIDRFGCPICFENPMPTPIYVTCPNGHSMCATCYADERCDKKSCHFCRAHGLSQPAISLAHMQLMSDAYKGMVMKCEQCDGFVQANDYQRHRERCIFMECPLCEDRIVLDNLTTHLDGSCREMISALPEFRLKPATKKYYAYVWQAEDDDVCPLKKLAREYLTTDRDCVQTGFTLCVEKNRLLICLALRSRDKTERFAMCDMRVLACWLDDDGTDYPLGSIVVATTFVQQEPEWRGTHVPGPSSSSTLQKVHLLSDHVMRQKRQTAAFGAYDTGAACREALRSRKTNGEAPNALAHPDLKCPDARESYRFQNLFHNGDDVEDVCANLHFTLRILKPESGT